MDTYRNYNHRICFVFTYEFIHETEYKPPTNHDKPCEEAFLTHMRNYIMLRCFKPLPVDTEILHIVEDIDSMTVKVYMTSKYFQKQAPVAPTFQIRFDQAQDVTNYLDSLGDYE